MPCWPRRKTSADFSPPPPNSYTPTQPFPNGSIKKSHDDGRLQDLEKENTDLKKRLDKSYATVADLQQTQQLLQRKIEEKESEIKNLQDTLRSVLPEDIIGINPSNNRKRRRTNVFEYSEDKKNLVVKRTQKTHEQKTFLTKALYKNDFLKYLNRDQANEIIECVQRTVHQNGVFIKEGTRGDCLYILESGELQVTQGDKFLRDLKPPVVFGELAILYNCKRTATVTAKTPTKVWKLERTVFQSIMRTAAKTKRDELRKALRNVQLMKQLGDAKIAKLAEVLEEEVFQKGDYIIRQGTAGETFYIIMEGEVDITENKNNEVFIRTIGKGSYFGEQALRSVSGLRGANVIAKSNIVRCMTLEKKLFLRLIGARADIWDNLSSRPNSLVLPSTPSKLSVSSISNRNSVISLPKRRMHSEFNSMTLDDLNFEGILGVGGFGRVELRSWKHKPSRAFALKCMKKIHIVETKQENHIFSEKHIMRDANCSFMVQLYRTFKDDRYVYMLMEACLGGELWAKLRDDGFFDEPRARFYTACVVEALDYLHQYQIVYRDLKPENLLLDSRGFVKLVDFGFAKSLKHGEKTWTFCGTPEYVAPEVILNKGHDIAVDYWALGILIFEMLTGNPPFNSSDAMKTYRMALRGIDAIDWPQRIGKTAQNLIRRLCRDNPAERIGNLNEGVKGIKDHRWFSGFDWKSLNDFSYPVAYVPEIASSKDLRNFDRYDNHKEVVEREMSGWDEDF